MTARRGEQQEPGVPPSIPTGTPTPYIHPDQHSWILQSIGEMRESIGGLKHAVETLTDQSKDHSKKLESISHRMYAATVVITLVLAALGWIISNLGGIKSALDVLSRTPVK